MSQTPPTDIPPHWKFYRVYIFVPRQVGMVSLKGGKIQTDVGVYEFGKVPAASEVHAIKLVWDNVSHFAPALLDANGNPLSKRRIDRSELRVAEAEPDPEHRAALD